MVIYYTLRMSGFQLGVSYAPAISDKGGGQNFPDKADRNLQYYNGISVGANYVETLGEVDVAFATGYRRAQASRAVEDLGGKDYQAVTFGINMTYAGVTIGGSYANELHKVSWISIASGSCGRPRGSLGTPGSLTAPATGYSHGEMEGAPPGTLGLVGSDRQSRTTAATVGFDYRLTSGIHTICGIMYGRWDAESGAINTGVIAVIGLTFYY